MASKPRKIPSDRALPDPYTVAACPTHCGQTVLSRERLSMAKGKPDSHL
ncbi:hypothetical protein [Geitlerinema sp. PCC 9228]|nr:hypothetical protein [Geitlerinema sp. PCC 9228]